MADEPRLSSEIRDWIQALVIVAGVGVGIWQFWFKEIWAPAIAPINITMEVSVREAGFRGANGGKNQEQFEAIELAFAAKNPSGRDVYLLRNCWYAQGVAIITGKQNESWTNVKTNEIATTTPTIIGAYYTLDKAPVVGAGLVFADQILHPNKSVYTSTVLYVPRDVFDALHVMVKIPTTAVFDSAEADWTVTPDEACTVRLYRKRHGSRAEEIKELSAAYSDRTVQFQTSVSMHQLSLWQSKPH